MRPPTRGAPEAAGSGYGRGGRKTKTGGRRWRGLGWRAIAGLWSRCASATGRAGSTASTLLTRRLPRASAGVPLLSLPFLRVRGVAAATKPRLPKVGSPTLGSVVVRRTAGAGYPCRGSKKTGVGVRRSERDRRSSRASTPAAEPRSAAHARRRCRKASPSPC